MSVAEQIRQRVKKLPRGEPFTTNGLIKLGSRPAVDKALSRLVEAGLIKRVARGVFVRPKKSPFIGNVMPDESHVVNVIAKGHGETIQVHGAEAARRFKISTQMPTKPIYYTSGSSREIQIGKLTVKLMHTSSHRKLLHAGKKTGLALTALWYLGKEKVNTTTIQLIQEGLSSKEFETLRSTSMPAWMTQAIEAYDKDVTHA